MTSIQWPQKTRELQTAIFDSARWNALAYRDDDIVIATWGKSGTTWMQQIVGQLVLGAPDGIAAHRDSPWLDMRIHPLDDMLADLEARKHWRFLKTHLPVDALVFSPSAKYIYVGRDVLSTEEIAACDEAAARNLTLECSAVAENRSTAGLNPIFLSKAAHRAARKGD